MSTKEFTGHPEARRAKKNPLAWVLLALLAINIIALNYIGCREYGRVDLSEYESYSISERTLNILKSDAVQNRKTPIRIIFAFPGSSPGYHRMYMLLEEYKRNADGMIEVECFDPLRQPGRARQISDIYGVKFDTPRCIVDARDIEDKNKPIDYADKSPESANKYARIPGSAFVRYETQPDGRRKVVALMMDEVLSDGIIRATEGRQRKMYVVTGKGDIKRDNNNYINFNQYTVLPEIASSLNIKLEPYDLPEDRVVDILEQDNEVEGIIIVAPTSDFTPEQVESLRMFWDRNEHKSIFIAFDPNIPYYMDTKNENSQYVKAPTFSHLYQFIREKGIHPGGDNCILKNGSTYVNEITVKFPPESLMCARNFWNNTTQYKGQSRSFRLEHDDPARASLEKLTLFNLVETTAEYYGEMDKVPHQDSKDLQGPLCVTAAVTKGSANEENNINTLVVMGNVDMLTVEGSQRKEFKDYMRSVWAWMTERPEYAGKSSNYDLTVKIDLNRHTRSAVEHLTLIIMPLLALLIGLVIWNTRRH